MINILVIILSMLVTAPNQENYSLTVEVSNIDANAGGSVRIGLYSTAASFPEDGGQLAGGSFRVEGTIGYYTFDNLSAGDYALALYHDMNGNDKMDKNFVGIPKEPYAFSNNASATFGPPSFEEAKVVVNVDSTTKIKM